ncbi:hypothetical protein TWF730_003850 [Orbilia blumenaviensis]|uniref:Uncharacterized protein n=1 Tax=Orbilia blumenaviensis TaxID=1796055 RepID=A0AAV9U3X8_9PEZI
MRILLFSASFVLPSLIAILTSTRLVYSQTILIPLKPYWRIFLADNEAYLDGIVKNLKLITKNEKGRCPIQLPKGPGLPAGPSELSIGFLLGAVNRAGNDLQRLSVQAQERLKEKPDDPAGISLIRDNGFNSVDDVLSAAQRMRGYVGIFLKHTLVLQNFLDWVKKPIEADENNELLKYIYNATMLSVLPGVIPGTTTKTAVVELDMNEKDDFIARFLEIRDNLEAAAYRQADDAIAWGGSLGLPMHTSARLFPEGPWAQRDTMSVMYRIDVFFRCWLKPIQKIIWNLKKLTPPPEVQFGLELQSRPEGNPMTGELEGWDWEHGTDNFPGLLKGGPKSGPSTQSDISTTPVEAADGDAAPGDFTVHYVDPDHPLPGLPGNNVLPLNGGAQVSSPDTSSMLSESAGQVEEEVGDESD